MLNAELTGLSESVSSNIISKGPVAKALALQTLKAFEINFRIERTQLDTPLLDMVSRFTIEGLDWKDLIGRIIAMHNETKPRSVKVFSMEKRYKRGTLILPLSEPGFIYELEEDYVNFSQSLRYKKYSLDVSSKGEIPEIKIGQFVQFRLATNLSRLEGSRVFLTEEVFVSTMFSERSLFRKKLASTLIEFTSAVSNRVRYN